jgi:hypothetical protein
MKNLIQFLASITIVALSILSFPGCSLFDKVDDISFNSSLTEYLEVIDNSTGQNVAYSETIVIDATTDPDVNKYLDKIKGFTLQKLTYQIVGVSNTAPGTLFSGNMSFGAISSGTPSVAVTITNLDVNDLSTVHELTINQSDINTINSLLKTDKAVKFYLTGTLSQTPVNLLIEIIMDVKVDADAL